MKSFFLLLSSLALSLPFSGFEFSEKKEIKNWRVINDGVMGGLSQGRLSVGDGSMVFEGSLSLENNGGFASIRAPYGPYDLSSFDSVAIECRGMGGEFALMFEKSKAFYLPYYMAKFSPEEDYQTFRMSLDECQQYVLARGQGVYMDRETRSNVLRLGFIKGDKREGPFRLELKSVRFY